MGMLDTRISPENRPPAEDRQYVYNHYMAWLVGDTSIGHVVVQPGTEVTWVVQQPNKSYHFQLKGDDRKFCTSYGWSLVLNTPNNLTLLADVDLLDTLSEIAAEKVRDARKRVETLA